MTRMVNNALKLRRDDPRYDCEISVHGGFPWRCDIWDETSLSEWPLFATAWGKTKLEAQAKANSIVQCCGREDWIRIED